MQFSDEYHHISRRVIHLSQSILEESLSSREKKLKSILGGYVPPDDASEYAYMFLISYGEFSSPKMRQVERLAAALNLLQASTFIIDDVLDESSIRYDEATIWSEYGTGMGVACGHLMEAIAVEALMAEAKKRFPAHLGLVTKTINAIVKDVYLGQIMDLTVSVPSPALYRRMIAFTTGNFFKHIARLGGGLRMRKTSQLNALGSAAYSYGMALQITDDILDLEASPVLTGKDYAADLKNRRPRLPIILAMAMATGKDKEKLFAFVDKKANFELKTIVAIIQKCGALEKCSTAARRHIQIGRQALAGLPQDGTRQRLDSLLGDLLQKQLLE